MQQLQKGTFYGQTNSKLLLQGLTITDTEYIHDKVDWHYHETPYFTFLLQGNMLEGNKKDTCYCSPGTLLFHNWQDAHYNIKPKGYTRGFHIELDDTWMSNFDIDLDKLKGSLCIDDPAAKLLFYKILRDSKTGDNANYISIPALLLQTFSTISRQHENSYRNIPMWVGKIKAILHDMAGTKQLSLMELSLLLNIHPVHLSRDFSKYFHCTIGEYIRKLRIEKALALFASKELSLTEIAFEAGFADQSHFIRCFKTSLGISPLQYRKHVLL